MRKRFEELTAAELEDELLTVFHGMIELLKTKRRSYGPGNLTRHGVTGIVIRMGDKMQRLDTMIAEGVKGNADGDSMEDAFRDMIGYASLALVYLKRGDDTRHPTITEPDRSTETIPASDDAWQEMSKMRAGARSPEDGHE